MKLIAALVATILTVVGIVVKDTLIAVLGILVVLDLLAISELITGSTTLALDKRTRNIAERATRIEDTSVDILNKVKKINIEMLNEARAVGIVGIFTRRKDDDPARRDVLAELERVQDAGGKVDLLGVALPDYFLRKPFAPFMENYVQYASFRALLLHPKSDAAVHRGRLERGLALTIRDIQASKQVIQGFLEENRRVQGHLYSVAPMVFLMITDNCVFLEPYHLGKVSSSAECIGGQVPFLKIEPVPELPPFETDTYTVMENHFEELWRNSEPIEIDLSIEFRRQADRCSLILTRPAHAMGPLDLSDWTLRRKGSPDVYSFPPGTVLEIGGSVTVMSGPGDDSDEIKYTDDDLWKGKDNLVLRNTAGSITARFTIA
jgi:hypothetical protein